MSSLVLSVLRKRRLVSRSKASKVSVTVVMGILVVLFGCGESEPPRPDVDASSERKISQGRLVGSVGEYGNHVWRGIPYAKAPVGEMRWRAPQEPQSWDGLREAIEQGAHCPQFASPFGGVEGETGQVSGAEDCLFLDIYASKRDEAAVPKEKQRVPVLVWIHGGGNVIGHAGAYDGGRLAETYDVVVVGINYRLGPLGWFRHASLRDTEQSAEDRSGNFGTLDMIRALEWVRDNIAAFGGDPNNVTIFGESAGGRDVFTLLVSPRAKGLFHRAISQSGGARSEDTSSAENFVEAGGSKNSSNEILLSLLVLDGIASDRKAAKATLDAMADVEISAYLRGQSAETFLEAYSTDSVEGLIEVPDSFRDGVVIPIEAVMERLSSPETWNAVPVIAGTNRDENKLFMYADPEHVVRRLGVIPRLQDEEGFNLEARYKSLMWKASGSDEPATAIRTNSASIWSYRFDWDEEPTVLGADLSVMLGAAHGFEIPFVFGHFDLGEAISVIFTDDNLAGREALASKMMSYWVEFATTGDPGRGRDESLVPWEAWNSSEGADKFMIFDTPAGGGLRMSSEGVTLASVSAAAEQDKILLVRDDRCAILAKINQWSNVALPDGCIKATPESGASSADD